MFKPIKIFVKYVEATNTAVGIFSMYLVFALGGVLLFESVSRTIFDLPHIWAVEIAQFIMAAYYLLGGGYSMIIDGHVRMDLLYGRWTKQRRAVADLITGPILIFYMVVLLIGSLSSLDYAIEYNQVNYTSWGPPLTPIKLIMTIGILLMLLQCIAEWFKDLATAMGEKIK
ncbi:MAG: TRAP transporter small permease subunit [Proteobacteria bacterium]|nr:TRAP transporter small permease subunit [Pseudomonadota bacterium]MBU1697390.1 TRAP transporter small permease subunit [Pseudomonadota bacterium]